MRTPGAGRRADAKASHVLLLQHYACKFLEKKKNTSAMRSFFFSNPIFARCVWCVLLCTSIASAMMGCLAFYEWSTIFYRWTSITMYVLKIFQRSTIVFHEKSTTGSRCSKNGRREWINPGSIEEYTRVPLVVRYEYENKFCPISASCVLKLY